MFEGPGAGGTVLKGVDHLGHRQIQSLTQGHSLGDGGIAAGHQHLVHSFHLLPTPQVIDALKNGAAGSWALDHRSTAMLEGSYPLGFRLSLHRKDLGIALDAAKAVQLDLPVTTLVEQLELDLIQNGHGDEDVSALHRWNQTQQES